MGQWNSGGGTLWWNSVDGIVEEQQWNSVGGTVMVEQ